MVSPEAQTITVTPMTATPAENSNLDLKMANRHTPGARLHANQPDARLSEHHSPEKAMI